MARAGTRIPDRCPAGHHSGVGFPSCRDVPDCLSPGAARAGDWVDGSASLRARQLSRAVEAGLGCGREAVGNLQRLEFWSFVRAPGHRRLYRTIPPPDYVVTLAAKKLLWRRALSPLPAPPVRPEGREGTREKPHLYRKLANPNPVFCV